MSFLPRIRFGVNRAVKSTALHTTSASRSALKTSLTACTPPSAMPIAAAAASPRQSPRLAGLRQSPRAPPTPQPAPPPTPPFAALTGAALRSFGLGAPARSTSKKPTAHAPFTGVQILFRAGVLILFNGASYLIFSVLSACARGLVMVCRCVVFLLPPLHPQCLPVLSECLMSALSQPESVRRLDCLHSLARLAWCQVTDRTRHAGRGRRGRRGARLSQHPDTSVRGRLYWCRRRMVHGGARSVRPVAALVALPVRVHHSGPGGSADCVLTGFALVQLGAPAAIFCFYF